MFSPVSVLGRIVVWPDLGEYPLPRSAKPSATRCGALTRFIAPFGDPPGGIASVRLNPSFANDGAVFLMFGSNYFAKLVTIAKINMKSKRRHALLDIGKLGSLLYRLANAGDDFR